ncbi:Uncharacterized membrane protein YhaH, DUF805 family [Pelagirhabdus alkalitolerans]|uniref:Uncharacterized membrane protein YhaH, DUF805 family n=1 Tax=Pelagirhabdus alkalitolerans TaxID=1612202 RepID=A0A1G6GMC8_9BACI|nr:DUF805 domain-containing protein [Pelagirhabdus alkalitolerans]SDB83172.1 Uncharacterized membrane protein YhaH, DUF805 family [Pelagirhabdus alkalitolerans]
MQWYLQALQNYANFEGRARRMEYWMFALINAVVALIIGSIPFIGPIYGLLIIVPTISVTVRRLHDIGRSGWWFFINFVPIVGSLILLIMTVLDSQPGTNEYGVNPKE